MSETGVPRIDVTSADDHDQRRKLFAILKESAFRRGRITLASGSESDFYFDMKPAMLDPEGAGLMAELIFNEIQGC